MRIKESDWEKLNALATEVDNAVGVMWKEMGDGEKQTEFPPGNVRPVTHRDVPNVVMENIVTVGESLVLAANEFNRHARGIAKPKAISSCCFAAIETVDDDPDRLFCTACNTELE